MMFTALEAMLLASFISCIVGLIVRVRSVTPRECEERRRLTAESQQRIADALEGLKVSNDIQFRMLRAIVVRLNLTSQEVADILNMGPTKAQEK